MTRVGLVGCTPDLDTIIAAALADDGIDVSPLPLTADTARTAARLSLDALLVDGHPFTDVPALIRALREQPETRSLPVVVLTARERTDLTQDVGWVEQVALPFDVDALTGAVRRAVGARRR